MSKRQFNAAVYRFTDAIRCEAIRKEAATIDEIREWVSDFEPVLISKFSETKLKEIARSLESISGLCFTMHYNDLSVFISKNIEFSTNQTTVLEYLVLKYV